jgi:signal transduction histidine kinase
VPDAQPPEAYADLLDALAHELRSPVAAIGYLAELLAGEAIGPRERSLAVAHIASSAAALDRTCDALAELGRLERGGDARPGTPVDVAAAVRHGIEETEIGERTCTPDLGALTAAVDHRLLRRLVTILLGETASRTPAGTTITVRLHRDDRGVLLTVEDDAAWRGQPPRVRLGTLLARRFAEAHGGQLRTAERQGGGTSVTVLLAESEVATGVPRR